MCLSSRICVTRIPTALSSAASTASAAESAASLAASSIPEPVEQQAAPPHEVAGQPERASCRLPIGQREGAAERGEQAGDGVGVGAGGGWTGGERGGWLGTWGGAAEGAAGGEGGEKALRIVLLWLKAGQPAEYLTCETACTEASKDRRVRGQRAVGSGGEALVVVGNGS
ncbi:unnamed protein product [Closterium sp. NIES-64]|nr:unnamed protein product [Closterium sp. NIES-64]